MTPNSKVDIAFLVDETGSFADDKANIIAFINEFAAEIGGPRWPATDTRVGFATFRDAPDFNIDCDFGYDLTPVESAAISMNPSSGGDDPEGQMYALQQAVSGFNWSDDRQKFICVITDSRYHDGVYGSPKNDEVAPLLDGFKSLFLCTPTYIGHYRNFLADFNLEGAAIENAGDSADLLGKFITAVQVAIYG